MNILGIIAELNPLHTGHEYLFRTLRQKTGADFCVVAMSGDYVQRGEPAFFPKRLRVQAALLSGADLVLELPVSVSTGSAEYFAEGAVSLFDKLGCVTHLGFGSESGSLDAFLLAGRMLTGESETYRLSLQKNLQAGMNFPKARYEALSMNLVQNLPSAQDGEHITSPRGELTFKENIPEILPLLEAPNNILGTEYMKALKRRNSPITPVTIKRTGADYHEKSVSFPDYASAAGLRNCFAASPVSSETETLLEKYVPEACRPLYKEALITGQYLTPQDFYLPLFYALQYADKEKLSSYQDVTPELAGRILRFHKEAASYRELLDKIEAKNLTSARVRRSLLHILLQLTKASIREQKEADYCLYARILGFRKEAGPLLSELKKHASVPLVSKLADARFHLSPLALSQLRQTVSASELYRTAMLSSAQKRNPAVHPAKCPSDIPAHAENEYTGNLVIL